MILSSGAAESSGTGRWDEPLDWTAGAAEDQRQWLEERVAGGTAEMPLCIQCFSSKLCWEGKEGGEALGRGGTLLEERGRMV